MNFNCLHLAGPFFILEYGTATFVLFVVGKMIVDMHVTCMMTASAEILPLDVRGTVMLLLVLSACIAGALSPFILLLVSFAQFYSLYFINCQIRHAHCSDIDYRRILFDMELFCKCIFCVTKLFSKHLEVIFQ